MRFRKKPVEIEARRVPSQSSYHDIEPDEIVELSQWCGGTPWIPSDGAYIEIHTLEGVMRANEGDWIIQGVQGEFYPCKPDIFDTTYEPVETT